MIDSDYVSINQSPLVVEVRNAKTSNVSHIPSHEQTRKWAEEMLDLFEDGFQWTDIPRMMRIAQSFLAPFPSMSLEEKRGSVVQILDDVIDITDTPFLPDEYSDPIFKALTPMFVNILISDETLRIVPVLGKPSPDNIQDAARNVLDAFKDGFQWQDFGEISQFALQFAEQYGELSANDKAGIAKQIIDFVIDQTDTPYMIDSVSDPIFKQIIHPFINAYFQTSS